MWWKRVAWEAVTQVTVAGATGRRIAGNLLEARIALIRV